MMHQRFEAAAIDDNDAPVTTIIVRRVHNNIAASIDIARKVSKCASFLIPNIPHLPSTCVCTLYQFFGLDVWLYTIQKTVQKTNVFQTSSIFGTNLYFFIATVYCVMHLDVPLLVDGF